jgi:hypothetical protein
MSGIALDSQARLPTFIGIVREDGGLVPIAIFDGREWWNRWPWSEEDGSASKVPVPESLDAIPADWLPSGVRLPREWTLLLLDGGRRKIQIDRPFRPSGWTLVETIVLRSTYPSRPIQGLSDGSDDVGVAIAGRGRIEPFVTPSHQESQRILTQLQHRLADLERKAIDEWKRELAVQPGAAAVPVSLTRTYRGSQTDAPFGLVKASHAVRGQSYHYLDGEKLYFIAGDERYPQGCKLNVWFEGVVVTQAGRVVSEAIGAGGYAEYCGDRPGSTTPLATLNIDGKLLWIVRASVEDGYDYLLFDPNANEPLTLKDEWRLRSNR